MNTAHFRKLAILVAIGLCGGLCSADEATNRISASGEIRIGYRANAIPFSYELSDKANPTGFAIEICDAIVVQLQNELKLPKLKTVYVPVDTKTRFSALVEKVIDMECANTTVTSDRRNKGFDFAIPYYITGSRVLVQTSFKGDQLSLLKGAKILVAEGTTTESVVKEKNNATLIGLKLMNFKKRVEAYALLDDGVAHGLVEDEIILFGFLSASKNPRNFKIVGNYLTIEPLSIMFKNSPDLKKMADQTMRQIMRSGQLATIHTKWFEKAIPPKNISLAIPLSSLMKDMIKYPSDAVNAFP
jgi:ABC-type amino acid transport substrate-binding protein